MLLCRSGDVYFVRKYSASADYNPRLDEQAAKQARLSNLIRTPRVLDTGRLDGLVFFDMEFVSGHEIRTYAPLQHVAGLPALASRIVEPLVALARTGMGDIGSRMIEAKVASVVQAIESSRFFPDHAEILGLFRRRLEDVDWSGIPRTEAHGDLTLENMLVREDGEIVFIDLLDGELDSVWLDAAKLLHDLDSGWSLRSSLWKAELSASDRLMAMLSRYLYEEVRDQVLRIFPEIRSQLPFLRALQAMRVLPYVRDAATFGHAVRGLDRLSAGWT